MSQISEIQQNKEKSFPVRRFSPSLTGLSFLIALLFVFPVIVVTSTAFQSSGELWHHLISTVLTDYIVTTLLLAIGVALIVAIVGTGTAWLVTMCKFPGVRFFEWALILPMAVPAYVMAYTYTDFLQVSGPVQSLIRELAGLSYGEYWFPEIRSLGGATIMLGFVLYPYVYMLARATFNEQSICALEVSRTLGAGPFRTFFRVALPLARPGILAGTALALMETLADFGTVSFFGIQTFTTGIVNAWLSFGDLDAARQLATCLLVFVFMVITLERLSRRKARYHHATNRYQTLPDYRLSPLQALLAFLACFIPLLIGFIVPALILIAMSFQLGDAQFGPKFFTLAGNSFTIAAITAVAAVLLALPLVYAQRLTPGLMISLTNRMASMGYAIPGTVVALGVLFPLAAFDNALASWTKENFGFSTGLLLTGSVAALVFAYLVRFMAASIQTLESGLQKIRPSMEDASRTLGMGKYATLWHVHMPMMKGSLLTAGLMVFVDVMKELPATLVMRPFNFDTLAVQAYNLASDERLSESSTASLTIVLVGLLPTILLSRAISKSRAGNGETAKSKGREEP
ncbi:ABC transporter permease [Kiloniella sp. b19]|uniref:ABC transporter permease n=1 Tax=Kiloniella sp. GXU_MW_B19 TaxID=3141326 RepID=UPI0031CE076C